MEDYDARIYIHTQSEICEVRNGKVLFQHKVDIPYVAPETISIVAPIATPSAPVAVTLDDEDQKGLMRKLSKLFEKSKSVKSLKKTLTEFLVRMQKKVTKTIAIPYL